jgi:pimeloyl-ACP methyl ester carboxylesterase
VSELPTITRRLLLVAAVDHDGDLAEVLGAAAAMLDQADAAVKPEAPAAAVEARLVEVDEQGLRFRHPLVVGAATRAAADGDHELAVNLLWLVAQRCFWADPGRIDVLTLIVHGDDDQIVPIDASARRSVELVSGATLKVYPGAPHGLAQVAPHKNQFNTDLLAFLKAEPPTCTAGLPWSGSADAVHGAIRRSIGAVGLGCGA